MENPIINFTLNESSTLTILNLFKDDFMRNVKKVKSNDRSPIYTAFPYMYRIWYYSTQIDGTAISPANFINSLLLKHFGNTEMVVPIPNAVISRNSIKDISFKYHSFSISDHPVLEDIIKFLDNCSPCIELDEYNNIKDYELKNIKVNLTFYEEYYYIFLVKLCLRLGLLIKMPSINTSKAQVSANSLRKFCKLSKKDQLLKVVKAAITEASEVLSSLVPNDSYCFAPNKIEELLCGHFNVDEFLEDYFCKMGISVENLFQSVSSTASTGELGEDILAPLSIFFSINSLLDSMLLTPLGYYLQIIQPIYADRYDFKFRIKELIKGSASEEVPLQAYFFESCTAFDVTPLGKDLLLKGSDEIGSYQTLDPNTDYKELTSEILNEHLKSQYNVEFDFLKFITESVNRIQ